MKKEKSCENCRYYLQHYAKDNTKFHPVFCGHCIHRDIKNYKKIPLKLCENWEDIAIKKEESKKSIKEILEHMAERLNEISIILKNDEE